MKSSVIIATFQGAARITDTLAAIDQQECKADELIVVIDGSTDGTLAIIDRQIRSMNIKVIEQPNRGRAAARNAGARMANGDVLVFYDDDMVPATESIGQHLRFHDSHARTILVGNAPQRRQDSDFNLYRSRLSEQWVSQFPDRPEAMTKENLFMTAANCSMRRAVFLEVGGFDESLRDAEDKEFAIRAFEKSMPVFFDKKNVAWHDERITCRSYIRRLRQYAEANRKVISLHPAFASVPATSDILHRWAYRLLASRWWVDRVDKGGLSFLPESIRYRLYGAVTFALSELYPGISIG